MTRRPKQTHSFCTQFSKSCCIEFKTATKYVLGVQAVSFIAIGFLIKFQNDRNIGTENKISNFEIRLNRIANKLNSIIGEIANDNITFSELEKCEKSLLECGVSLEMLQIDINLEKKRNKIDRNTGIVVTIASSLLSLSSINNSICVLQRANDVSNSVKFGYIATTMSSTVETDLSVKYLLNTFKIGKKLEYIDQRVSELLDSLKWYEKRIKEIKKNAPKIVKTQIDDNEELIKKILAILLIITQNKLLKVKKMLKRNE